MKNEKEMKELIRDHLMKIWEKKLDDIGKLVVLNIQKLLKGVVGKPTKLTESIKYKIEDGDVIIYSDSEVALFLEKGTKPHIIRPKNGKLLAFRPQSSGVSKKGNKYEYGKKIAVPFVNHPGFEARPYFEAGIHLSKTKIKEILAK